MAEDGRKTSLPEKKRLVAEAIRKLTDAKMSEKSGSAAPKASAGPSRHKSARPAPAPFSGQDA
jgi:hypothetical protein